MAHDIFISYSSKNKQTADAICHVLEQNNLKCWIAPRNIQSGKPYAQEIMDGLKNAKIVVLVFSKDSQESPYVNNEIDTAFSNNKPIISFKIDESLPEDKMEFFLKNKHWLDAYPNPEEEFETLVRDARSLCEEEKSNPNANHIKSVLNNADQLPKIKNSIGTTLLLFTPLYSFSFLYRGLITKKNKWIIAGILYLIPLLLSLGCFISLFGPIYKNPALYDSSIHWFLLFWFIAIIHGVFIRREYSVRRTLLKYLSKDDESYDELLERYMNM